MIGSGFIDDLDNDLCGDFFDHIDDLLDFPMEDVEGVGGGDFGGECNGFQGTCWPPMADALAGPTASVISGKNGVTTTTELPTELSVPYEDIAQLEWLSNFVEDSFSAGSIIVETDSSSIGGNVINNENSSNNDKGNKDSHQFQTSSPVSVLESSSSSAGGNGIGSGNSSGGFRTMPLSPEMLVPGRARSKRPRPATFNPRPHISLISPTSSATEDPYPFSTLESASELDNYAESFLVNKMHFEPNDFIPTFASETDHHHQQQTKKKKKKKLLPYPASSGSAGATDQPPQPAAAVRKCLHCEITKTPQWRAGPLGPKTLCNACGVRYKSGRLFPEYRPAASPTFVSSLHSNSHKKVIEMRIKATNQSSFSPATTPATPELVPNNNPSLDYI
ncbi:GATA transcription factor 8-like [Macadamia integrifolia]|uniref:GATA transcription factor 8-like n=1 Tax=Macadamia integrifolia TaxID=60698 RepID=UPI001C4F23F3|nr:GATA transcription factor 8-like [Macadamia integrifolia]XP_042512281.1 GATA transcription factor 8-like [Macadamia integrifolia]XP_042512282.1 GATA transcription factor 8-like [Macadamia integrifolia]XP_042512283.1 GATA transcription factor 8-like [Macadamia integrifolia]